MNSSSGLDQNLLMELLSFGEDQNEQFCNSLAQSMQPPFREAISVNKLSTDPEEQQQQQQVGSSISVPKPSPRSVDRVVFDDQEVSKKRKTLPKWSCQVRVSPGAGVEVPLDDGHSWRKYGQKDILGAKYPRGYYRCKHRKAQGCLATKRVQRCDVDPLLFDVTYRGEHTCFRMAKPANPAPSARRNNSMQEEQRDLEEHHQQFLSSSGFSSVETQGLVVNDHNELAATASLGCFVPGSSFSPSSTSSFCTAPDEFAEIMYDMNSGADLPPVMGMDFMLQTAHGFDLSDPDSFFPLH